MKDAGHSMKEAGTAASWCRRPTTSPTSERSWLRGLSRDAPFRGAGRSQPGSRAAEARARGRDGGVLAAGVPPRARPLPRARRGSRGPGAGFLRRGAREGLARALRARARALPHLPARLPRRVRRQPETRRPAAQARRRRALRPARVWRTETASRASCRSRTQRPRGASSSASGCSAYGHSRSRRCASAAGARAARWRGHSSSATTSRTTTRPSGPRYADLASEFSLPVTQVTNHLHWARQELRRRRAREAARDHGERGGVSRRGARRCWGASPREDTERTRARALARA